MISTKDRRHSGRKIISIDDSDYPIKLDYYNEYKNYRDGRRNKEYYYLKRANKTKKHESIRKRRKIKQLMKAQFFWQ